MTTIRQSGEFVEEIAKDGFVVVPDVIDAAFVTRMRDELESAIRKEVDWHKGTDYRDYGMVLLCPLYGGSFIEIFDNEAFLQPIESVMGKGCILYAYTSSSLPPEGVNYSTRIHVDCPRHIENYITNFGVLIALDEFTEENGATLFLPGSHKSNVQPSDAEFYSGAVRILMSPGSVCYFNARTWHTSTPNRTPAWRHGVSMNICRPFMKQRIDIPRAIESRVNVSDLSQVALQKLGFHAQVPASYEEYYAAPEHRKFKQQPE